MEGLIWFCNALHGRLCDLLGLTRPSKWPYLCLMMLNVDFRSFMGGSPPHTWGLLPWGIPFHDTLLLLMELLHHLNVQPP